MLSYYIFNCLYYFALRMFPVSNYIFDSDVAHLLTSTLMNPVFLLSEVIITFIIKQC